jgi:hypothetical protein
MASLELNFLRTRPQVPPLSWLLILVGVAMVGLAGNRYLVVSDDLAREKARGAGRNKPTLASRVKAEPAPLRGDTLLTVPWRDLFARLEAGRPASIAFMSLDADGRKGTLTLTAEARKPADMVDYLETLRQKGHFSAVTLNSHTVMEDEEGLESVHFVVRMGWKP